MQEGEFLDEHGNIVRDHVSDPEIREVAEEEAEATLTLRIFVPGVSEGSEDRYFLTRKPQVTRYTLVSRTVEPDGSSRESWTSSHENAFVSHSSIADGVTKAGRGVGCIKSISIRSGDAPWSKHGMEARVHLSMSWTDGDGRRGQFDRILCVPWLGSTKQDLGRGGWLAAEITPISQDR